ncbi:lipoyl domain-containing protein [Flavobacteriales bacterium]|nr:lipoyl domain-containing protein [Flavobacteriales bacterium]
MNSTDVKIVKWYVNEGDFVTRNQLIAELESGDFYQELHSGFEGKIKFLIEEGQFGKENDGACLFE